jgi:RNA polymerase-binding transcription factor DksA
MKDENKLQYYKEKLEKELDQLTEELGRLGIKNPQDGDWGAVLGKMDEGDNADPNMKADRDEEFLERANVLGEIETRYKELQDALYKINHAPERYGMCEESNQPIEEDRLEANPAARTCKAHM